MSMSVCAGGVECARERGGGCVRSRVLSSVARSRDVSRVSLSNAPLLDPTVHPVLLGEVNSSNRNPNPLNSASYGLSYFSSA
jgi:hypothetical protein